MIEFKIPLKVTGEWGLNKKYSGEHLMDKDMTEIPVLKNSRKGVL